MRSPSPQMQYVKWSTIVRVAAVVDCAEVRFGDCQPDRFAEALAERTGRRLDAGRAFGFGMAGRLAAELTEVFDVVERKIVAGKIEQRVEQHRAVAGREHETVAIEPMRIAAG